MKTMKQLLSMLVVAGVVALPAAENVETIAPGLRYQHRISAGPVSLHILEVDPSRMEIVAARALNNGIGREEVSSLARRKGALAAVNGGFFSSGGRYDGDPAGVLKIGASWYSAARSARPALGWSRPGRKVMIGYLAVRPFVRLAHSIVQVDGLNQARGRRQVVLYNSAFHRSTLTDPSGIEVAIAAGTILQVRRGGDSPIPGGGFVLSVGPDARLDRSLLWKGARAVPGYSLQADGGHSAEEKWLQADFIVGGAPLLLRGGKPVADLRLKRLHPGADEQREPRTAVGVRGNGWWVFVVVDGRQAGLSRGLSIAELSGLMRSLRCVDAINLDGGGSSELVVKGRVVSNPSDFGVERPVSDAIVIRRLPAERNRLEDRTPGG